MKVMEAEGAQIREQPRYRRFVVGRNPTATLLRILVLAAATLILFKFVLLPIRVTGHSMLPTYKDGQIRFVNRLSYVRQEPRRGDVVAVEFRGKQVLLLKRIVGMPGEKFHVFNGEVYINGEKLDEPYAYGRIPSPTGKGLGSTREAIQLGPTEYMVIGDNRPDSEGFIKDARQIIGKVL